MNMLTNAYEWTPNGPRHLPELLDRLEQQRRAGRRLVTTNGCFDVLHIGHVRFLSAARALGDLLVVGLNSDASVHRLKGSGRPIVAEADRAAMLAALRPVDHVVVFDDLLPNDLLARVRPALHCKAGDYRIDSLPEAEVVRRYGGEVRLLPLMAGHSTSRLIERVLSAGQDQATVAALSGPKSNTSTLERLLDGANVLRQTAYGLRQDLARAGRLIADALARGHRVIGHGDAAGRSEAQRFVAELLERTRPVRDTPSGDPVHFWATATIEDGQAGDILLILLQGGEAPELQAAIAAARARAMVVIALAGAHSSPSVDVADLSLRVPSNDQMLIRPAQAAVLGALVELVEQLLVEEHGHG